MASWKKSLKRAVGVGLVLFLFCPIFPLFSGKNSANLAWAKKVRKSSLSRKLKKKKVEKKTTFVFPLKTVGEAACIQRTNLTLFTLWEKSRPHFENVTENIGVVECTQQGSGVFVFETPVRFRVGQATYQSDLLWYASVLVHEACHADLYKNYLLAHPDQPVPSEVFSGASAEEKCLGVQYEALKNLGADKNLIRYLETTLSSGYWKTSYNERWW